MKNSWLFALISTLILGACKNEDREVVPSEREQEIAYATFGQPFTLQDALSSQEMLARYEHLKPGDTLEVSFESNVSSVCKSKGCWMELDLPEEENVMVKFKDYGFFVPKDIEENIAFIHGKAYIAEVSVEEQQHYAADNGESEAAIAAITQPKRTLSFIADGVLIEKTE